VLAPRAHGEDNRWGGQRLALAELYAYDTSSLALQPYHLPVTQLHTTPFRRPRQGEDKAVGEHLRLVCHQGPKCFAIHLRLNVP